jgi:hypothetical protein
MTLDLYQITVTNRIVGSGQLDGANHGVILSPIINQAIAANGNQLDPGIVATGTTGVTFFTNGIDTRTRGGDFTFNFPVDYDLGHVNYSIGATYNETVITAIRSTSNLFNRFPNKLNSTLLAHADNFAYQDNLGVTQYPGFSPFGINGGFYFAKATLTF